MRQGMSAWMQLHEPLKAIVRTEFEDPWHRKPTVPRHGELLSVLTGLVLNIAKQNHRKETAWKRQARR